MKEILEISKMKLGKLCELVGFQAILHIIFINSVETICKRNEIIDFENHLT